MVRSTTYAIAALLGMAAMPAQAQDAQSALTGTWYGESFPDHVLTTAGEEPPLTEEGLELYRANLADAQTEQPQFDRTRWCAGPGMPRIMFMPVPFELVVNEKLVGFIYGWYRWHRTVDMSGEPVEPLLPQTMGYPVGHWEGDTLVIHSNGLISDTIIDASGLPHSDDMELDERYRIDGDGKLHVTFRITDPEYYSAPWETQMTYARADDMPVTDDICPDRIAQGGPAIVPAGETWP